MIRGCERLTGEKHLITWITNSRRFGAWMLLTATADCWPRFMNPGDVRFHSSRWVGGRDKGIAPILVRPWLPDSFHSENNWCNGDAKKYPMVSWSFTKTPLSACSQPCIKHCFNASRLRVVSSDDASFENVVSSSSTTLSRTTVRKTQTNAAEIWNWI